MKRYDDCENCHWLTAQNEDLGLQLQDAKYHIAQLQLHLQGIHETEAGMIVPVKRFEAMMAVVEAAQEAVQTIDTVLELTDASITVNISGKDYRFDATKELKEKLKELAAAPKAPD